MLPSPRPPSPRPLASELRLAAERLLGDKRVRTDRAGMDLIVDQMVKLQQINHANSNSRSKGSPDRLVAKQRLAVLRQLGLFKHVSDFGFHPPRQRPALQ